MFFIRISIILVLAGCISSNDTRKLSAIHHQELPIPSQYYFSLISSEGGRTAGNILFVDRLFSPPVGLAEISLDGEDFILSDKFENTRQGKTIHGNVACDEQECVFELSVFGVGCPTSTHPISNQFLLSCGDQGDLHLLSANTSFASTVNYKVQPTDRFEYYTLGDPFNKLKQVVPFVSRKRPIVFALGDDLKSNKDFIEDLEKATTYWNNAIGFTALRFDLNLKAKGDGVFDPLSSNIVSGSGSGLGKASSYNNPETGEILSGQIALFDSYFLQERQFQRTTLAHELGHVLGLAHNFAASQDYENHGTAASSSVMDYSISVSIDKPLSYDQAAISWIYKNVETTTDFRSCNDQELLYTPYCERGDNAETNKVSAREVARGLLHHVTEEPDFFKLEVFETMNPDFFEDIIRQKELGNKAWYLVFLNVLSAVPIIHTPYKIAAFGESEEASEVGIIWGESFRIAAGNRQASYSDRERDILLFLAELMEDSPVNSENLSEYKEAYSQLLESSSTE